MSGTNCLISKILILTEVEEGGRRQFNCREGYGFLKINLIFICIQITKTLRKKPSFSFIHYLKINSNHHHVIYEQHHTSIDINSALFIFLLIFFSIFLKPQLHTQVTKKTHVNIETNII